MINPIFLAMLESEPSYDGSSTEVRANLPRKISRQDSDMLSEVMQLHEPQPLQPKSSGKLISVLKKVVTNPVVYCTLLGVVVSVCTDGKLPPFFDNVLDSLSSTFVGCALLLVGAGLYGNLSILTRPGELAWPLILTFIKMVCQPIWSMLVAYLIVPSNKLVIAFAFFYGCAPAAASPAAFAAAYKVGAQAMSAYILITTVASAPMMVFTALLLSSASESSESLHSFLFECSVIAGAFVGFGIVIWVFRRLSSRTPLHVTALFVMIGALLFHGGMADCTALHSQTLRKRYALEQGARMFMRLTTGTSGSCCIVVSLTSTHSVPCAVISRYAMGSLAILAAICCCSVVCCRVCSSCGCILCVGTRGRCRSSGVLGAVWNITTCVHYHCKRVPRWCVCVLSEVCTKPADRPHCPNIRSL